MHILTKAHLVLFDMVQGWGGNVVDLKDREAFRNLDDIQECPFDNFCGINWDTKTFYYDSSHVPNIGVCIHEISHIFACLQPPDKVPSEIDFFAFEYTLANQLGVLDQWEDSSRDYCLGNMKDYGIETRYKHPYEEYSYFKTRPIHKSTFWHRLCYKACTQGLIRNGRVSPVR